MGILGSRPSLTKVRVSVQAGVSDRINIPNPPWWKYIFMNFGNLIGKEMLHDFLDPINFDGKS